MNISLDLLKKLRNDTSAGVSDCRQALEDATVITTKQRNFSSNGDSKSRKKEGKETSQGVVKPTFTKVKSGLVEYDVRRILSPARMSLKTLPTRLPSRSAAMNPKNVEDLLKGAYIRDPQLTIEALVKQVVAKVGREYHRLQIFETPPSANDSNLTHIS